MTEKNKIFVGLAIVLAIIAIAGFFAIPAINGIESSFIIFAMLLAILFMLGCGILLAALWKGINLKNHGNSRWLIFIIVAALYVVIYFIPSMWFLSIAPLVLPFLGFWFARRFFNW